LERAVPAAEVDQVPEAAVVVWGLVQAELEAEAVRALAVVVV
jgi:hypothetical protein